MKITIWQVVRKKLPGGGEIREFHLSRMHSARRMDELRAKFPDERVYRYNFDFYLW